MLIGAEAKVTLTSSRIRIISQSGIAKSRSAFVYSCGNIRDNVFFYNNTVSVALRALTERVYFVKGKMGFVPCPKPTVQFNKVLGYFQRAVRRGLSALPSKWTTEEFVQSYSGQLRGRYAKAAAAYTLRGVRRNDGYLKTFIKAELYNGTSKLNPCPRLIQPRDPVYNVGIGRFIRPSEKLIYKAIDQVFGHHVVLKCDNMWKRAESILTYWNTFNDPVFVGLDASRFDQHVSAEALEFEHGLYNSLFNDKELAQLLSWQVNQVGFANMKDGCLKYKIKGCRASGDMNTALGNVYLMCAITHHFLKELGVNYRFINDGDDCGIFLERKHLCLLDSLPEHHLKFGFEMEVEPPAFTPEEIEFCQCRPVQLAVGKWMMVRNIHKAMLHDFTVLTTRDWATTAEVLVATSRCGLALYADVPVLSEMYLAMSRFPCRENVVRRILDQEFSGHGRTWRLFASQHRKFPVDETVARVSIYKAFGILPDMQILLENQYRAFTSDIVKFKSPILSDSNDRNQYILD